MTFGECFWFLETQITYLPPRYPKHTQIKQKTHNTHTTTIASNLCSASNLRRRPQLCWTSTCAVDFHLLRRSQLCRRPVFSSPASVIRLFSSSSKVCFWKSDPYIFFLISLICISVSNFIDPYRFFSKHTTPIHRSVSLFLISLLKLKMEKTHIDSFSAVSVHQWRRPI